MKCAIIDVGSNTIRLSVYQTEGENFRQLFTSKETAGLASYIEHDQMSKEGIACAAKILNKFHSILQQFEIDRTDVFATASLRNIENSREAVKELFRETGYDIHVISGHQEALCDFYGVTYHLDTHKGMIFDVGGGSTELILFDHKKPSTVESVKIGSLNLYNKYVSKIIPKPQEIEEMEARANEELDSKLSCKIISKQKLGKNLIGVGGTIRAVLKLVNNYYHLDAENRIITKEQLDEIFELAQSKKKTMQTLILKICPERIHTIIPGMVIIRTMVHKISCDKIVVSKYGVREGYLYCNVLSQTDQ